ncbi:Imm1 family immunity protein [Stackebrandtia albiflava]|nr:Imm1 family immunity protein [Stackebrandtia albiflava]
MVGAPEAMDALVETLTHQGVENRIAALYVRERPLNAVGVPDHEMYVAVDPRTGSGALRYMADGAWYSSGESVDRHSELWFCYMGEGTRFPGDSAVPLDTVRQAAREFLTSGGERPTNVRWQTSGI